MVYKETEGIEDENMVHTKRKGGEHGVQQDKGVCAHKERREHGV